MSDREKDLNPEEGHPQGDTLPEQSEPQGEAQRGRPSDFEGEKAGKGGDHPTPGAGEHDDPHG